MLSHTIVQKHRSLARSHDDPSADDSTRPGEDISFARGRRRRHRRHRRRRRARDERVCILDRPPHPVHLVHPTPRARNQDEARTIAIARARDRSVAFSTSDARRYFFYPPPATLRARDRGNARAPPRARARDIRARVFEINFLESPLVVSPPGVEVRCRHHGGAHRPPRRWFCVRIPFKSIPSIGKHHSRTR